MTSDETNPDKTKPGEPDVPTDPANVNSRATGGVAAEDGGGLAEETQDRNSSTGTTPNENFVGRASGDETGDTDQTGGEKAVGRPTDAHEGALRDD